MCCLSLASVVRDLAEGLQTHHANLLVLLPDQHQQLAVDLLTNGDAVLRLAVECFVQGPVVGLPLLHQ